MTETAATTGRSSVTTAWVWGGGLLIVSALIPTALQGVYEPIIARLGFWLSVLAFAAAMLLFAFGWRGVGAVSGTQRYGAVALIVVGLWPVVWAVVGAVAPPEVWLEPAFSTSVRYADLLVPLAAAIIAVVAIWRGEVVPRPWNRAPAWALVALASVSALVQIIAIATQSQDQVTLILLGQVSGLISFVVPVGLGILAIVLGLRVDPRPPVAVYPPAE